MGEVPKDRVRAPFLAVGDWNGNVKILGLSPENLLEQVCVCVCYSSIEVYRFTQGYAYYGGP